jgi:hypothetical protein
MPLVRFLCRDKEIQHSHSLITRVAGSCISGMVGMLHGQPPALAAMATNNKKPATTGPQGGCEKKRSKRIFGMGL